MPGCVWVSISCARSTNASTRASYPSVATYGSCGVSHKALSSRCVSHPRTSSSSRSCALRCGSSNARVVTRTSAWSSARSSCRAGGGAAASRAPISTTRCSSASTLLWLRQRAHVLVQHAALHFELTLHVGQQRAVLGDALLKLCGDRLDIWCLAERRRRRCEVCVSSDSYPSAHAGSHGPGPFFPPRARPAGPRHSAPAAPAALRACRWLDVPPNVGQGGGNDGTWQKMAAHVEPRAQRP